MASIENVIRKGSNERNRRRGGKSHLNKSKTYRFLQRRLRPINIMNVLQYADAGLRIARLQWESNGV